MKNIILIILLSICFSLSESKTLSLQGTVFGDDGSVIAGATVFARPCGIADSVAYGNASDGNGRYQLQLPACDSLRLSVTYSAKLPWATTVVTTHSQAQHRWLIPTRPIIFMPMPISGLKTPSYTMNGGISHTHLHKDLIRAILRGKAA